MNFRYGIDPLTIEKAVDLAQGRLEGVLCTEAKERVTLSKERVRHIVDAEIGVYGINTGFGPMCDTRIESSEIHQLQKNLILSHAVGVGHPISPLLSKLMLVCKVHSLSQGYSGVSLGLIERLMLFIHQDLIPVVPSQGSVGASGDLAPLAHLFLPLLGEGEIWENGKSIPSRDVLHSHGLDPLELGPKEGLALINGTQFILAHAVIGLEKMNYLLDLADVAGAMSLEGLQGSASPFREELHRLRPFKGNQHVAKRLQQLLNGSENLASHQNCTRVQDPYSLRCMPQVHGASRDAWEHLKNLVEIELNAVTDNPIILSQTEAISGGNFHGQPLAMAIDYCSLSASELGNISDRRCYLLLEGRHELPALLVENGGLNSGYMIPQYTTAALVSENKSLCFPASADSIPTSLGQEDHVSMGSISGRKLIKILNNLEKILAIELMLGAQAMEFRRPLTFSIWLENIYQLIRTRIPFLKEDRLMSKDIQAMIQMVENRALKVKEFIQV